MDTLRANFGNIRVAGPGDKVFKDECMFSFDTPLSEDGLYVCMKTFLGFSRKYVVLHHRKTGNAVFLHIKTTKTKVEVQPMETEEKPTVMGIGVAGGFALNEEKYEFHNEYNVVVLPDFAAIPLNSPDLPELVQMAATAIITADSAAKQEQVLEWVEERKPSKHAANLVQLDNGVKIPPSGWKCANCDITDNLWLNLTDGSILCGRRNFDGSGGNNHAADHYAVAKHPLAVKLGTITPEGADVYSYDEGDMVLDPLLDKHLAHFGINMAAMKKTVATMAELEIEAQFKLKAEWDRITEAGKRLEPLAGPGYTGINNLGNTCYMNSILQVVFSMPEFADKYFINSETIFEGAPDKPQEDYNTQMAKLAYGLLSGEYALATGKEDEQHGVSPSMFKSLIGKGHPEFSTNKQQDAREFLEHFLSKEERAAHSTHTQDLSKLFSFEMEQRVQCNATEQVRYSAQPLSVLSLPVDLALSVNEKEVAEYEARIAEEEKLAKAEGRKFENKDAVVRPIVPFDSVLQSLFSPEVVGDWYSPAIKAKTTMTRTQKFKTFPKYLAIAVQKFYVGEDWSPKKKDVSLALPTELDLTALVGSGIQPGETPLPEDAAAAPAAPAAPAINEDLVRQLVEMGFHNEGCRRAAFHAPGGVEPAMEWIMAHMDDPDFTTPFVVPGAAKAGGDAMVYSEEGIMMITSMGFTEAQAKKALKATSGNVERAADWIFSHMDELDAPDADEAPAAPAGGAAAAPVAPVPQGSGRYRLLAIVSHMGSSTQSGHYVCHIHKDGKWAIFNDSRVALSENPPFEFGYLYIYESV